MNARGLGSKVVLCLTLVLQARAWAAPGDVVSSFGVDGIASAGISAGTLRAIDVLTQSDGKAIVVAQSNGGGFGDRSLVLLRYRADGSPDPTFGDGGKALHRPLGSGAALILAAALQADDKLLVLGAVDEGSFDRPLVMRFRDDGTLDASFGSAGVAPFLFALDDDSGEILVQEDGKIVFAISARGGIPARLVAVVRLLADGTPDAGFGASGARQISVGSSVHGVGGLAIDAQDRVIVAGILDPPGVGGSYFLARLFADGQPDPGLGGTGQIIIDPGVSIPVVAGVATQADGGIITLLDSCCATPGALLMRHRANGTLDEGFGEGGIMAEPFAMQASDVAVLADGSIVVAAAAAQVANRSAAVLLRYRRSGKTDRSFDVDGIATFPLERIPTSRALAVGGDGALTMAGDWGASSGFASRPDVFVLRATSAGAPDAGFGGGVVVAGPLGGNDTLVDVVVLPDGKLAMIGTVVGQITASDIGAARFHPDGTLDTSLGGGGAVELDSTDRSDLPDDPVTEDAFAAAAQPDGKIVVAGWKHEGDDDFLIARITPTGVLDPSFGEDGTVTVPSGFDDRATDVAVAGDGTIVAVGPSLAGDDSNGDFKVVRLLPNGAPDPSFDGDGVAITDFDAGSNDAGVAVALAPDGAIVVGGYSSAAPSTAALARYLTSGALDPSFGAGGKALVDVPGLSFDIAKVAIAHDGSIFATGQGVGDIVLARFDSEGVLDASFGSGGVESIDFDGGFDTAASLALQPDGKLLVGVESQLVDGFALTSRFLVIRYAALGAPDPSFGAGGRVDLPVAAARAPGVNPTLTLTRDGSILVGFARASDLGSDFAAIALAGDSASLCGNGRVEPGEWCDDGNATAGDGCSASCNVETCHRCVGEPSSCSAMPAGDPACETPAACRAPSDPDFVDSDGDGTDDDCDLCPHVPGVQMDHDADGIGTACDLCPTNFDPLNRDNDHDGAGDACEFCLDHFLLESATLDVGGLKSGSGDERIVLRGSFDLLPGMALEPANGSFELEIGDASGLGGYRLSLAGAFDGIRGWQGSPTGRAWRWRGSLPGPFGQSVRRVRLSASPANPQRVNLYVSLARLGFARLPIELPLHATALVESFGPPYDAICVKAVFGTTAPACELAGKALHCG